MIYFCRSFNISKTLYEELHYPKHYFELLPDSKIRNLWGSMLQDALFEDAAC